MPKQIIVRADWNRVGRSLRQILVVALVAGLVVIGRNVTPSDLDGNPLLLSPRVAKIAEYQRQVQEWTTEMERIENGIEALLSNGNIDLFTQDSQIQDIYRRATNLVNTIDETSAPDTLAGLQDLMADAAGRHLIAASDSAKWVSEPSEETYRTVIASLDDAAGILDRVYQNPWLLISQPVGSR